MDEGDEEGAEPAGEEAISCNLQDVVKACLSSFCTENDYDVCYSEELGINIPDHRYEI